jgi:hypothetical protein
MFDSSKYCASNRYLYSVTSPPQMKMIRRGEQIICGTCRSRAISR